MVNPEVHEDKTISYVAVLTSELDWLCSATSFTRAQLDSWSVSDSRYFLAKEASPGHSIPKKYSRKGRCHLFKQETLEHHVLEKLYAGMYICCSLHVLISMEHSCMLLLTKRCTESHNSNNFIRIIQLLAEGGNQQCLDLPAQQSTHIL